jgi:hypothetical protein
MSFVFLLSFIILGIILVLWLSVLVKRKKTREKTIDEMDELITSPITNISTLKTQKEKFGENIRDKRQILENIGMSTGAGALSIFEMWKSFGENKETLDLLNEQINKIKPDAGPFDYLSYFQKEGIEGVRNKWIGAIGEDYAVKYLNNLEEFKEKGFIAWRYDDPSGPLFDHNHEGTDIYVTNSDGKVVPNIEYQVKSYQDVGNFLKAVESNPAPAYIVNSDLYQKLLDKGLIQNGVLSYDFDGDGIIESVEKVEIIDGKWNHGEAIEGMEDVVQETEDAADISDKIPWVALGFYAYKQMKNIRNIFESKKSVHEGLIDATGDAVNIGVRGMGAWGGAESGALAGSAIFPGIGTIVGGVAGALVGAMASGSLFRGIIDWFKYNELRSCYHEITNRIVARIGKEKLTELLRKHFNKRFHLQKIQEYYAEAFRLFREKTARKIKGIGIYNKNWEWTPQDAIICRNLKEKGYIFKLGETAAFYAYEGIWNTLAPVENLQEEEIENRSVLWGAFCYDSPAIRDEVDDLISDLTVKIEKERKKYKNDKYRLLSLKAEIGTIQESLKRTEIDLQPFQSLAMSGYLRKT